MVNVAVIGLGNMGAHHARVYASFKDVTLVGVSDINTTLGQKLANQYNTAFYPNYKELLQNHSIDILSIAVPTIYHEAVAIEALETVKNILIEKPITDTVVHAKKILSKAKRKKAQVYVGYVERFNPAVIACKEVLRKKLLGDIVSIVVKRVGLYPPRINNADVITDLATHDIDILHYILGMKPKIVSVTGGKYYGHAADYAELLVRFGTIPCFIQTNWITPVKIRKIEITGSKGYMEVDYINQKATFYSTPITQEFKDFDEFLIKVGTPKIEEIAIQRDEPLRLQLRNVVDTIDNKTNSKLATGDEAVKALQVAEKALIKLSKRKL